MNEVLSRLLNVGDLDTTITQLQHRKAALAEKVGLAAVEAQLAALDGEAGTLAAQRSALVATQKDLEAQIAVLNERREAIEKRMYAATGSSTRDLQAMSDEVLHLSQRRAELEEQELVAMVDQEPIDAQLRALDERRAPVAAEVEDLRAVVADSAASIDTELEAAVAARASAASELPTALADRYETLRQRLKSSGVARLVGRRCEGCHLELPSVEVERIRHAPEDTVVTCEQCGRILVPT